VKSEFIKGNYEETQSKSGKFVENVYRVLHFILTNQVLAEIKSGQMEKISESLRNANSSKYDESIRLLIPNIAQAMIYQPRSKRGSVHVKPITPDYIDAKLTVEACDWIVAELLRLHHTKDSEKVSELIKNIVKDYVPIIEKVGDETFVNAKTECEDEILIRLSDANDGLTRKEMGESMKYHFSPVAITRALKKLIKERDVFPTKNRKFVISEPARKRISKKIVEITNNRD
jgi:hypothetical protein